MLSELCLVLVLCLNDARSVLLSMSTDRSSIPAKVQVARVRRAHRHRINHVACPIGHGTCSYCPSRCPACPLAIAVEQSDQARFVARADAWHCRARDVPLGSRVVADERCRRRQKRRGGAADRIRGASVGSIDGCGSWTDEHPSVLRRYGSKRYPRVKASLYCECLHACAQRVIATVERSRMDLPYADLMKICMLGHVLRLLDIVITVPIVRAY